MAEFHLDTSFTQNRELSWLKFNLRVLQEAEDERTPLFERLKFVSIFTSNLDEFFMIRVGSLFDLSLVKEEHIDNKSGMSPSKQLAAIYKEMPDLYKKRDKVFKAVTEELKSHDVCHLDMKELEKPERKFVDQHFREYVLPILSPQIVDGMHPFPHLINKGLYVVVQLKEEGKECFGIIPAPASLPKVLFLPGTSLRYVLYEQMILHFAELVFPMYQITAKAVVSVTRNADISPEDENYEIDDDYRRHMKKVIKKRSRLAPVRLEIQGDGGEGMTAFLCEKLNLKREQVYKSKAPLAMGYVFSLEDKLSAVAKKSLTYPKFSPQPSPALARRESVVEHLKREDILLSYPYESMDPFLKLLREAAENPEVISIKITIYRLANQSKLMEQLAAAAEAGKEVTALFELRARFDEENNIDWAERLEEAGCNVSYGFEGFKVHSKICLITRREKGNIRYITQIGTGNYNEKTAKLYTDYCLMTANQEIGLDAAAFFNNMAIANLEGEYKHLLVAPDHFKTVVLQLIDEEIQKGSEGRLCFKLNSISDRQIIDKLMEASCAGVKINMIVRGICCLLPGVPGRTENIRIRSIVGRFLEHPRVYVFGEGPGQKIYISSADFMTRNTEKRVEIACPVLGEKCRQKILSMLRVQFADNVKARMISPTGEFVKRIPEVGERELNAQLYFMEQALSCKPPQEKPVERKQGLFRGFLAWLRGQK